MTGGIERLALGKGVHSGRVVDGGPKVFWSTRSDGSLLSGPVAPRGDETEAAIVVRLADELDDVERRATLRLVK